MNASCHQFYSDRHGLGAAIEVLRISVDQSSEVGSVAEKQYAWLYNCRAEHMACPLEQHNFAFLIMFIVLIPVIRFCALQNGLNPGIVSLTHLTAR